MIVWRIREVRTSCWKREVGDGMGAGKKEEKCCEKVETSLVFSGRREVGREGMWDQEGAEREN